MKTIVFTILAITLSFGTITASELNKSNTKTSIEYPNISTFCKLIIAGNYDAVKMLIENGTNINRKSTGLTPLMFAARYNKVEIVKLLIKKGAKLKVKSERGYTALNYAKMSKADEAYKVLLSALDK
ncbi:ankyrin repeat domain-containing protein [Tenacibaculum ovolyticum]|uniref:ankyrin repeat domain-containing protein n=1 Tax=Tenacibaculum ovolyticum TaxID=104270 RepID=UPI0022F392AC|nr:ankyrin repeat domain-containing protein [Tenacibaculum ovolyticum]WBX76645.1 ankyrin repeat domain-containing protein [Tenacibaculum ovolyticum]